MRARVRTPVCVCVCVRVCAGIDVWMGFVGVRVKARECEQRYLLTVSQVYHDDPKTVTNNPLYRTS